MARTDGSWQSERDRIARECEGIRSEVSDQVRAAMLSAGLPADSDPSLVGRWYDAWIDKAADEQWYLGLADDERASFVVVDGLSELEAAVARRDRPVLLVGAHLHAHTVGLVHLDFLGLRQTILVHDGMLSVMHHYGLRNSTWTTPGRDFSLSLRSARENGGLFVSYADVGTDGGPLVPGPDEAAAPPPVQRMVNLTRARVFTWQVTPVPGAGDRHLVLRLRRTPWEAGERGAGGPRAWVRTNLLERPETWMLWRQVPTAGTRPLSLRWPGADADPASP
ncbi:hypothetical protein [Streptomyces sp. BE230]|uniref:hypothetical protein n=1 Tax=Streptomyces sp. BE230 TaxID=3002526 RepID=UPI002ED432ED|nr:hypothetical protein [Streptomyces sp. BE230]